MTGWWLCVLAAISCGDELPPGVADTQNPADVSLTPAESLARIEVPEGFQVTQFAAEPDIRRPIAFDFDDRDRLWVVENYSHPKWKEGPGVDRVVILEDTDGDGQRDKRTVFYDKGRYLTGIAYGFGGIWLANTPELVFIPDADGDDVPDGPEQVLLDGFQISTNNVLNNLHWGPDGWLYGAIGLSTKSLVGAPGTPDEERTQITRGIWRFHPTRHVFEKVAEGMVNPWGADFNEYGDLITANTVLAHLWHIVPGMYAERRANERDNPYAYQRIQTIANHLHWGGGGWQSSRNPSSRKGKDRVAVDHANDEQYQQHSVAGGGHAHCGAMIYLGDNWPEEYRGAFFTNNLHGNRVNRDLLRPSRSSYTGVHAADLFPANDPWFRGMNIKYGFDGGVYISDWHDFGECHDSDGSHRSSGRIYKFTWGDPQPITVDLAAASDERLVDWLTHRNARFARHAARLLQERSAQRSLTSVAVQKMKRGLQADAAESDRLQMLWALFRSDELTPSDLTLLTSDSSPHVRRWAIRLLTDQLPCDMARVRVADRQTPEALTKTLRRTARDPSAKVRLETACCLQRLSFRARLDIASDLVLCAEDELDPYIPLLIWYGVEPALTAFPADAVGLAANSQLSLIPRFVARRLMESESPQFFRVLELVRTSRSRRLTRQLLLGMQEGLADRGSQSPPANWTTASAAAEKLEDEEISTLLLQLATTFGDAAALRRVRVTMKNPAQPLSRRRAAMQTLLALKDGLTTADLHRLVSSNSELCEPALKALVSRSDKQTSDVLLGCYPQLSRPQRQLAVGVLATRVTFALQLLDAIDAGQIDAADVTSWSLQQLRSIRDSRVQKRVASLWSRESDEGRRVAEIDRLLGLMTASHVASGNAHTGRAIFDRTCAKCHRLFGEGGTIAPDLTGSGRKKADYVIRNLVDPSAEIDAAYRLTTVVTADGRVINGFIIKQDDRQMTIRNQDATVRLNMNDVDEVLTSDVSMMPEGMLKTLSDEQFRDLLRYLASDAQVDG